MRQVFFAILFLNAFQVFAQQPFRLDVWLNESRTPQKVNALKQDPAGYILVATDEGVFRYNGIHFQKLKSSHIQPAISIGFWQGQTIVGYKNGALGFIIQDSIHSAFVQKDENSNNEIHSIRALADGILLGTENGVLSIKNNSIRSITTRNGLSDNFIYAIHSLNPQRFIAATDHGINDVEIKGQNVNVDVFSTSDGLPDYIIRVMSASPEKNQFWLGTQNGGLALYDANNKKVTPLIKKEEAKWGQINDILPLKNSEAWIATEEGYLLYLQIKNGKPELQPYYFPGKKINALLQDNAGNLWLGSDVGLTLFTHEYLWHFQLPAPYQLSDINAMCFDKTDQLWLALTNDIYTAKNETLNQKFHFASAVSSLYCDDKNNLWVGTIGHGLWCKLNVENDFKKIKIPELERESVLSMTTAQGHLWVAGLNGVHEISYSPEGKNISPFLIKTHNKKTGVGTDYIYQLYADKANRVWMATDGAGVCMYDGKQYRHWDIFKGQNNVAYSIAEDRYGHIWAGTLNKSLFQFSENGWKNRREYEPSDNDVNLFGIAANMSGQVIAIFQRRINLWYAGSKTYRHFNNQLGLGINNTSPSLNCFAKDASGQVYIPYDNGILIFKNQSKNWNIQPKVRVTSVKKNFTPVTLTQHKFEPNENFVSISFDGICFTNPERLMYRYRLKGFSNKWIPTNETSVTFPKLPPGKYTFEVGVSLNEDFSVANAANFTFEIAAPIWKRWWFILASILILGLLSFLLLKYRDLRAKRILRLKQERTLFEYEHLKSQVNPHFLFNSLNTLTSLIETNTEDAIIYAEQLSDLYRNMLAYKDCDLIPLADEWEILQRYLHIQQTRFGEALNVVNQIDNEVMQNKRIVPMSLQLLVENAIKHNVVSRSLPLVVTITSGKNELIVRNKIQEKIRLEKSSGLGLTNIRKRYALLGKKEVSFGKENEDWVVQLPLL